MIVIDSREKPKAINKIVEYFEAQSVEHITSKLIVGDYMVFSNPSIVVDRKQTISELVKNCTTDKRRFLAEIERAQNLGVELVILVEQNRYKDRDKWIAVNSVWDLYLWSDKYTTIRGESVMRTLAYWSNKYPFRVEFCDRRSTGRKILEILGVKQ